MAASRLVILGVAVLAAAGAGYVAKRMMVPPEPQVVVEQQPATPAVETTDVLVVKGDVPMGAQLGNRLEWLAWPSSGVDANFITRDDEADAVEKYRGSIARVSLYSGDPVRKSRLIGEGQSFMSSILPHGHRAVAVQISADTSAGGFILPNDHVDVIMTRRSDTATSTSGFVTETILKNIRVLAIDQAIQEDEEGRRVKVGETATLELTPQQAEIMTVAQQLADRLTLSLRAVVDTQEGPAGEADHLVSGTGKRGTIRMIKSGEVSEVGARK